MPRSNTFYRYIVTIKPSYRFFITILGVGFFVSAWLYGVYFRLERTIQTYQKESAQLRKQAVKTTFLSQTCQQLEQEVETLRSQLQPLAAGFHDAQLEQSRMLFLIKQAKSSGLNLNACKSENAINKQWHTKHATHIDLTGTIDQVKHFFAALNNSASKNMLQCNHITMNRTQRDSFLLSCDPYFSTFKEE